MRATRFGSHPTADVAVLVFFDYRQILKIQYNKTLIRERSKLTP